MEPIILASKSPQRQDILRRLNIPFVCIPSETDETFDPSLPPEKAVEQIALRKAEAVLRSPLKINTPWIIAADTLIFSHGTPMGKPADVEQARSMLQSYSGAPHKVITAICCYDEKLHRLSSRISSSNVCFKALSDAEIEWYLSTGEWQGAARSVPHPGNSGLFYHENRRLLQRNRGLANLRVI